MALKSLDEIHAEDFALCIDKVFEVSLEEGGDPISELKLITMSELNGPITPGGRVPFSLTFQGSAEAPFEQGIYWLKHSNIGVLGIFLVPIGEKGNTRSYEAIFA